MVVHIEPQEPAEVIIVSSHALPPPPEPAPPQITSTTLEAKGVCLGPQQLKELKALATERDKQKSKKKKEEWCDLLDCVQYLF